MATHEPGTRRHASGSSAVHHGPAAVLSDCPDGSQLDRHARGESTRQPHDAGAEEARRLDRHLSECRACLSRYLKLARRSPVPDIPNCHIVSEIGRGRFGVVYKAWRLEGEPSLVALKILSGTGEMERSRFEREIAVLKKIHSPRVVRCLDAGVTGDAVYFVMDYVQGVHLDEYLASMTDNLKEKLTIFRRVCLAVADAHAAGVVHRDLKPRNILIDADGQPHILDFGICTVETPDWSSWARHTITRAGDIIGTLRYMSPEQAWGGVAGAIDERSDIWSLGIMLYEIVTDGDYPYSLAGTAEKPPHEHLLEQLRKELPRLPRLDQHPNGRDLEILLERCLAWEPRHRIQSVDKLSDDLARYCRGGRIKTKRLWIPHRLKRVAVGAATRSRWTFAAAFMALLAVTLWSTVYLFHVGWNVSGRRGPPTADAKGEAAQPHPVREAIRVIGIFDDTIDAVVSWAARNGIDGVSADITTWRGVHGHLMERLSLAGPRVIVWDYFFRTPQAHDARFVQGLAQLEKAGVPVVLAVGNYGPGGRPDLSAGIVGPLDSRLRHGGIIARDMVKRPGEFVLALKLPDGAVVPGLALATMAAELHPDTRLDLDWSGRRRRIGLLYELQAGAYLRERDQIELTGVFPAGNRQTVVHADAILGCRRFALDAPEAWADRTVHYDALLSCTDAELESHVGGKLVIFGDMRLARPGFRPDRHSVRYAGTGAVVQEVPGCHLLADAVAGLLDGGYIRSAFPLGAPTFVGMLLVGFVGCLLPIPLATTRWFHHRHGRRVLWVGLLAMVPACWAVMIVARSYAGVHLSMAGFSLLAPLAGSLWVESARNRHRVLDGQRRVFEPMSVPLVGTLTLASKPRTSHPEAG